MSPRNRHRLLRRYKQTATLSHSIVLLHWPPTPSKQTTVKAHRLVPVPCLNKPSPISQDLNQQARPRLSRASRALTTKPQLFHLRTKRTRPRCWWLISLIAPERLCRPICRPCLSLLPIRTLLSFSMRWIGLRTKHRCHNHLYHCKMATMDLKVPHLRIRHQSLPRKRLRLASRVARKWTTLLLARP